MRQTLIALEKKVWEALSASSDEGRAYLDRIFHEEAVMLFPGGFRLQGKDAILQSLSPRC